METDWPTESDGEEKEKLEKELVYGAEEGKTSEDVLDEMASLPYLRQTGWAAALQTGMQTSWQITKGEAHPLSHPC